MTGFIGTIVEAWDEIRIHRLRVTLSLLAVGLAIAVMTTALALGQQMSQATRELTEKWAGRSVTLNVSAYPENSEDTQKVVDAVEGFIDRYQVEYASRVLWAWNSFSTRSGQIDMEMRVVDPAYAVIHRIETVSGAWFGEGDAQRLAPGIVVNEAFMDQLGLPMNLSQQPELTMIDTGMGVGGGQSFVVIGVVPNESIYDGPRSFIMYDSWMSVMGEDALQMFGTPMFEMWLTPPDAATATNLLQAELTPIVGQNGFVSVTPSTSMGGEDVSTGTRNVIFGIGVAVLALGALSLVNVSMVTVQHRVREIGIRRSFGAASSRVFFAIVMESVVGTFLAGVIGVALSIAVLRYFPVLELMGIPVQDIPPFPMGAAVQGILAATAIGALAGLIPGVVATRISPIDAIRA